MTNKKVASEIAIGIILLITIVIGGIFWVQNKESEMADQSVPPAIENQQPKAIAPTEKEGAICTQDAKLCDDGSYVSRTGPKCEFAQCPVAQTVKEGYKIVEVKNPSVQFSFEVPEKWLTETRNSGEKQISTEEMRDFLADVLNGDSQYADYTRKDFNKMSINEIEKMFKGSDWLPFPIASVGVENEITYSDTNLNQVDFYFLVDFDTKKTYFNEVIKGVNADGVKFEGTWANSVIGDNTVDIFSTPDGKKEISSGDSSGGKIYYIKLNNTKDMLIMNKQAMGDDQFEKDFANLIQTLEIKALE
ncbi:MAG: hypothetical protein ACD_8C00109G0003 [uncultured bacterium]|nr:MAG: hypothetical protein ACD_8C00109G0003 [uncultured bacterium]